MNDNKGILGNTLGGVGNLTKSLGQGIVDETRKTSKAINQQVIGIEQKPEIGNAKPIETAKQNPDMQNLQDAAKQENDDFVKSLYGLSTPSEQTASASQAHDKKPATIAQALGVGELLEQKGNPADLAQVLGLPQQNQQHSQQVQFEQFAKEHPDKSPDELQKMFNAQKQQHKETYYDPTFNRKPQPKTEEEQIADMRPQDRMEKLEEKDLKENQKKKEKQKPIAVDRAETIRERPKNISG